LIENRGKSDEILDRIGIDGMVVRPFEGVKGG
jgi:hypothetical protein